MTNQRLDHDILALLLAHMGEKSLMSLRLVSKDCCALVTPKLFASTTVKIQHSPEEETLQPRSDLRYLFHKLVLDPVLLSESALLLLETWLRQDLATYPSVTHVDIIFQKPRYLNTLVFESMEAFRFKEELVRLCPPHISLGLRFRNDEERWAYADHLDSGYTRQFQYCTYLGRFLGDLLHPPSHAIRSLSLQEMYVTPATLTAMTSLPHLEILEWLGSWHPDIGGLPFRFNNLRTLVFLPSLTISGWVREHIHDDRGIPIFNICARNQVSVLRAMLEGSSATLRHLSLHIPVHKVQDAYSEDDYIYEPAQLKHDCWFGSDGSIVQRSYTSLFDAFSDDCPSLELPLLSSVQLRCASLSVSRPSLTACLPSLLGPGARVSMPNLKHIDVEEEGNAVASSVPWESFCPDTIVERLDRMRYAVALCNDRQIALKVSLHLELDERRGVAVRQAGLETLEIVAPYLWRLDIGETTQSFDWPAGALQVVQYMEIPKLRKLGVWEAPGVQYESTQSSRYQHRPLLALLAAVRVHTLEKVEWHGSRIYDHDASSLCPYTSEALARMLEQIEGGECPSLQKVELSEGDARKDALACLAVYMGFKLAFSSRYDNRYSSRNFCSSQPLPRP